MTKMKSKKMNKSTFAIVIMAIVMVAILAFGGTYAYFTANAVGESVSDIKTAQLELLNNGEKMTYTATKEIVPGDYIFGDGTLNGTVDWTSGDHDYKTVDLDLGNTNAAIYAFVKIETKAYTGDVATAKPLMVKTGTDTYAPVLKLIPRLDESTVTGAEGWKQFGTGAGFEYDVDDTSNSTYIFYFKVADTTEARTAFNTVDFDFSLQFDYRVHADRTQNTQGQAATTETTNVYVEGETTTSVQIMNVNILFTMEFATIQQTGFNTPADAYEAAFKTVAERDNSEYTDNDMDPSTPAA